MDDLPAASALERLLGYRVDLGPVEGEAGAQPVLVGRDVEAIRIGADQGLIAEARAVGMRWRAVAPVIGGVDAEQVPAPGRVGALADRDLQVGGRHEVRGRRVEPNLQGGHEPPLIGRVEVALRIGHEVSEHRWIATGKRRNQVEELVQGCGGAERATRTVEHAEGVVDRLENESVADAQPLVRRFEAELRVQVLVRTGAPLVAMIQAVEAAKAVELPAANRVRRGGPPATRHYVQLRLL